MCVLLNVFVFLCYWYCLLLLLLGLTESIKFVGIYYFEWNKGLTGGQIKFRNYDIPSSGYIDHDTGISTIETKNLNKHSAIVFDNTNIVHRVRMLKNCQFKDKKVRKRGFLAFFIVDPEKQDQVMDTKQIKSLKRDEYIKAIYRGMNKCLNIKIYQSENIASNDHIGNIANMDEIMQQKNTQLKSMENDSKITNDVNVETIKTEENLVVKKKQQHVANVLFEREIVFLIASFADCGMTLESAKQFRKDSIAMRISIKGKWGYHNFGNCGYEMFYPMGNGQDWRYYCRDYSHEHDDYQHLSDLEQDCHLNVRQIEYSQWREPWVPSTDSDPKHLSDNQQ